MAGRKRLTDTGALAPPLESAQAAEELTQPSLLARSWESFYVRHQNGFFKARGYLLAAFPQLGDSTAVGEVGCGTGAALLPLLAQLPRLRAHGVDVSPAAVAALRRELAARGLEDRCSASVCDAAGEALPFGDASLDAVLMIFTLSALPAARHAGVLAKAARALKPGGRLLLRDYGLYDMVQTRCERRVGPHQYVKQDGIHCCFFSVERVRDLAAQVGLRPAEVKYCTVRNVNRKKQQHIDRVFLHAVLERPPPPS